LVKCARDFRKKIEHFLQKRQRGVKILEKIIDLLPSKTINKLWYSVLLLTVQCPHCMAQFGDILVILKLNISSLFFSSRDADQGLLAEVEILRGESNLILNPVN
jgi:hypothetical protein